MLFNYAQKNYTLINALYFAVIYTVEFQKKGLPHAQIILFLHNDDKPTTPEDIDCLITSEIHDAEKEPELYATVKKFMVHGPCDSLDISAPCMEDSKCLKYYPKDFNEYTTINDGGFTIYRRRHTKHTIKWKDFGLDNRYIVPYNKKLLLKHQAHLNIEWCNHSKSI